MVSAAGIAGFVIYQKRRELSGNNFELEYE